VQTQGKSRIATKREGRHGALCIYRLEDKGGRGVNPNRRLVRFGTKLVDMLMARGLGAVRGDRNVEIVLATAFERVTASTEIRDPARYVEFLRSCFERTIYPIKEVKTNIDTADLAAKRFATLAETLASGVPSIPFETAVRLAIVADELASRPEPVESERRGGDVGLAFLISSGLSHSGPGRRGRLLWSIVRFSRSERALELGTAFGLSAMFILEAMRTYGRGMEHLSTVEQGLTEFTIAQETLKRYGNMVSCVYGSTNDVIPRLIDSRARFDFLFHDAGHSGDLYVSDFTAAEPALVPGTVVLFDDIRWDDPRFRAAPARTYEGWLEVVRHPRVRQAIEIGDSLGLLLLR